MESKPPDLAPDNPASIKRGRFDTTNSPTMVYVRRKIDHDQQNKPSPSSETPKNVGDESAKESNLGMTEEKMEPNLECHEPNLEAELNELKGIAENLVQYKENDSILNPKGDQSESQSDSELCKMKVGASTVSSDDVAKEPELESKLQELEGVALTEVTSGEKEPNLSPNEEKSEPDLVCHETNLDADLVEFNVAASNQITSLGVNEKEIEHHLDADLQQQKIVNQFTNGDKHQNVGKNEPKLGFITPKQAMTDENNRSSERENYRERFAKLQAFLKDCDRSMQDDYLRSKNFFFSITEFSLSSCPLKY